MLPTKLSSAMSPKVSPNKLAGKYAHWIALMNWWNLNRKPDKKCTRLESTCVRFLSMTQGLYIRLWLLSSIRLFFPSFSMPLVRRISSNTEDQRSPVGIRVRKTNRLHSVRRVYFSPQTQENCGETSAKLPGALPVREMRHLFLRCHLNTILSCGCYSKPAFRMQHLRATTTYCTCPRPPHAKIETRRGGRAKTIVPRVLVVVFRDRTDE